MVVQLFSYVEIKEPKLSFHTAEENYRTINPIEGLSSWGPYDSSIPGYMRPNPLRLAIVCPERSFASLTTYLQRLSQEVRQTGRDEYVDTWPGFRAVFQTNIEIPTETTNRLVRLVPETVATDARLNSHPEVALLDSLKAHIRDLLPIRHEFDVLLVHIPTRWAEFREKRSPGYDFDLHDALKVFGAPSNIKIQILEQDTFGYRDQARVMWWLGLALYVKANGIPWKLAEPSPKTAFVGLSYGLSNPLEGRRIITGCSQVFDEHGQGLKFLLHPVENPVYIGRNPYLPREDARRVFETVRRVYQEVNNEPPERVVVHKTTHFTRDEMAGIATALSGVRDIELLQIQQQTRWRAIAYDQARRDVSGYPLRRGTVLPLDRYGFLLWTQGDIPEIVGSGRHYYQEKRGIPAPIIVRRFRGKAPLEQVASEILRLTKMNWNNNQLYSRLPATLRFSSEIAQIAKQLEQVWRIPYDFRYFI